MLVACLGIPAIHADDGAPLPIFDTHVHYSESARASYPPEEIIRKLDNAGVPHALVSSTPDEGTRTLHRLDPDRIVPFLRPYRGNFGQQNWFTDAGMIDYFRQRMESMTYAGIGEFHLHDIRAADIPVMRQTARLAVEEDYFLHVHAGYEEVSAIFAHEPDVKILWAHAGVKDPPERVSRMLDEYRNLWTDISIREFDIAPRGELDPAWRELFLKHPDRFTIGSDTYSLNRWRLYERIIDHDRSWLDQLPREVAVKIAYCNALRLFGGDTDRQYQQFAECGP